MFVIHSSKFTVAGLEDFRKVSVGEYCFEFVDHCRMISTTGFYIRMSFAIAERYASHLLFTGGPFSF